MPIEFLSVFLISTFFLIYSWYLSNKRIGFVTLLSSFLYLTSFAWIPLSLVGQIVIDYDFPVDEIALTPLYGVTLFYIFFVLCTGYFTRSITNTPIAVYSQDSARSLIFMSALFFTLSIFGYIALNGLSFSAGNYGQRLTANAGNGIFLIFFFLFIPVAYLTLLSKVSRIALFYALMISIIGGMLVYFTLGGSRNILAAALLGVIIIAQRLKLIPLQSIFFGAVFLITLMNYLAFVRYGNALSDDVLDLIFRYLIDSLSPYDSFNKIYIFFDEGDTEFKGFEHIMAQFNPLIPRALWPEKPVVPVTNAFFFTESILGIMAGTYIISPTLLGGLYIMGGWAGISLGFFVLVWVTVVMEKLLYSKNAFIVLFSYTVLPFTFFMVRESIELFINKFILMFCTFFFIWLISVHYKKLESIILSVRKNKDS